MVKFAILSYEELVDPVKNPTLCLSPLRGLNLCHQCDQFKQAYQYDKIRRLKCKPHLTDDAISLLVRKRRLLDKLAIINAVLEG